MRIVSHSFTSYLQRLIPLLNDLKMTVFSEQSVLLNREDEGLYSRMRGVLPRERERLE